MSLSIALRTALSGLSVVQTAMRVTADNITNANTPGYTRKTVELEPRRVFNMGAGVQIAQIDRQVDSFIVSQIRDQLAIVGDVSVRNQFLRQIQEMFGTPENNRTISDSLNNLKNALEAFALTPENSSNALSAVNAARQLTQQFNELAQSIQQLRLDADKEIEQLVGIIDAKLQTVAALNKDIARTKSQNQPTGALEDERDRALAQIAEYIDIRVVENTDGMAIVFTSAGRVLVNGGVAANLSHASVAQMNETIGYVDPSDPGYPGGVNGIFFSGTAATSSDITNEIAGGRLKGLIEMRDTVLPNLQRELDLLAQSVMDEINRVHNAGAAFPPPTTLTGSHAFSNGDVFSASGTVRIAVIDRSDGSVVEFLDLALGGLNTVDDVIAAINGMANASASLDSNGRLTVSAGASSYGIAIDEMDSAVTTVGTDTRGFSHFFGLNDLFRANINGSTYNSFATAQQPSSTAALGLTGTLSFEADGLSATVAYAATDSLDDIAASINADATLNAAGIAAKVINDGSGRRLVIQSEDGRNFLITDSGSFLANTQVRPDDTSVARIIGVRSDIVSNPALLARGHLSDDGLTVGDGGNATDLAGVFDRDLGFAATGGMSGTTATLARYAATIVSLQATLASDTETAYEFSNSYLQALEVRNANVSGVNIDEELASIIVLEQAYNASARVITVISQMFEELLGTVR